jgi:cell wall-associated NlpC family hydrolase/nucleotide-binding universal stress UspA family protein
MTAPEEELTLPTLEQLKAWPTAHFYAIADWLDAEAARWISAHEESEKAIRDADWAGAARDNAVHVIGVDGGKVRGACEGLSEPAKLLRLLADNEMFAKRSALEAVQEAENEGFRVNSDRSVDLLFKPGRSWDELAALSAKANEHAETIHYHVVGLVRADLHLTAKVREAAAPLGKLSFGENGGSYYDRIRLIDDHHFKESPGQPGPEDGKTTPADQLPLPTPGGHAPSPTEAARDNTSPDVSRHLADNLNPSPLLSGLSADQWRERLAHFHPGDPLPDPRTPTGDKAIDTLANAAGQQNTTYAWGGNKSNAGPSKGQPDNGDGANKYHDWDRYGYDCGGLVRYSVREGAGMDVGMGTNAIDTNPNLTHGAGHVPSATLGNSVAGPGDVLVFGGSTPFTGGDTDHTGIYIGNGYMINAPKSGLPVEVDNLWLRNDSADILKVPGQ